MEGPSNAAPGGVFPTGRAKWFWIALALALGAWLLILLVVSDREAPKSPLEEAARDNPNPFPAKAGAVFKARRDLRITRPSSAVPFRVNGRVDDGESK